MSMHNKTQRGIQSKLAVMRHFVDQGYYVYNETNNTGPVDVIAINPETLEVRLIEVKTMCFRSSTANWKPGSMIYRKLKPLQKELKVSIVYHNVETGEIKDAAA